MSFGMRLYRLLWSRHVHGHRSFETLKADLVRAVGEPGFSVGALIRDGDPPSPEILERMAPVLRIHTADLYVVAGLPVPLALAAAGPMSPWDVTSIVESGLRMNPDQRARLSELVRSLPVHPRTEPPPADDYPEGPGALLLRLLANRNIRAYRVARLLLSVGGGPYVSHATVPQLGPGRVVITPQYVTSFARLLGYDPHDMVALAGVGPVFEDTHAHPAAAELAALAWDARRLTSDQIAEVLAAVDEMEK